MISEVGSPQFSTQVQIHPKKMQNLAQEKGVSHYIAAHQHSTMAQGQTLSKRKIKRMTVEELCRLDFVSFRANLQSFNPFQIEVKFSQLKPEEAESLFPLLNAQKQGQCVRFLTFDQLKTLFSDAQHYKNLVEYPHEALLKVLTILKPEDMKEIVNYLDGHCLFKQLSSMQTSSEKDKKIWVLQKK